jgi:hypothetical protein
VALGLLIAALELAANDYMTCRVNSVVLKNRLCDVETDCRDACMFGSSESWAHPWHFNAGGGAVHSIKTGLMHCSKTASFDYLVGGDLQR